MRDETTRSAGWLRVRRATLAVATAVTGAALVVHFGMTTLYNAPFNPVKEETYGQVNDYMTPFFHQDWHLFAPDPVAENRGLLVRARVRGTDGTLTVTQWLDITTPGYQKSYAQRLWPSRVPRLPTGAIQGLDEWRDPVLERLREKQRDDQAGDADRADVTDRPLPLTSEELTAKDRAERFVASLASAEAVAQWGTGVEFVQARIVTNTFPRFSRRAERDDTGEITYRDLEWMSAEGRR